MSKKARRSVVAALALMGLTSVTAVGTWLWHGRATAAAITAKNAAATGAVARQGDLVLKVSATGSVEPEYTVEIKSKASGVIDKVLVQEGDRVEKKAMLVRIDPILENRKVTQAEADLRIAEAGRAAVQSKLAFAEGQLKRSQGLLAKGLASGDEIETQRKEVAVLRGEAQSGHAQVIRAREALSEAKDRLSETQIHSPIAGTVLERSVNPGTVVASGTTAVNGGTTLLKVADLSRLFVRVKVDEADVGRVAVGQPVAITADALPGKRLAGQVVRVAPQGKVDSNVTVFEVIVEVDEAARQVLRPMMTANVEIQARQRKGVVLVPARAVRSGKGPKAESFVLVAGQRRPVKTGETDGKEVEIQSGLEAGEKVDLPEGGRSGGPRGQGQGQAGGGRAGAPGGSIGVIPGMPRGMGR